MMRRPVWRPTWEMHRGWAKGFVHNNLWRVSRMFTAEEALQECAVIHCKCVQRYEGKVTNPRWFMTIYKTAVQRDFHTYARRNRRIIATYELTDQHVLAEPVEYSNGPLLAALSQASAELKAVIRVLGQAPSELMQLLLDIPNRPLGAPEEAAISRALCRLARVGTVRTDLLTELRDLLRE